MEYRVLHQEGPTGGCFHIEDGGRRVAQMSYQWRGAGHILIDHTEVDPGLRGRGVARQLLDAAADWARANAIRVSATCSYVVAQFARDPSLQDVKA